MARTRRRFDGKFKAKVALEAIRELKTISEIAMQFRVYPNQATTWKKQLLAHGTPEIFNTEQGSQFTSRFFTERLMSKSIEISRDGRGRALDNVFIERLWRSVKYEDIYLKGYESGADCQKGLTSYFKFYSHERPHQSLDYRTPWEVHTSRC